MTWLEVTIPDYREAYRIGLVIHENTFKSLQLLAASGRIEEASGTVVWSKLDRRTGETSFLFNGVASRTFGHVATALGAREVDARTVKIGIQGYGRLLSYGGVPDPNEDLSDILGGN